MRILYRQLSQKSDKREGRELLSSVGIENSYFKLIEQRAKDEFSTKKKHSHTGYEFHMVMEGSQTYKTADGTFVVKKGNLLAIPKGKTHALIAAELPLTKYAVTFSFGERADEIWNGLHDAKCCCFQIPERIFSNSATISGFRQNFFNSTNILIENCVFETIVLLLQAMGITEKHTAPPQATENSRDLRVELAKQFISDNIQSPLSVSELAAYCYVSEKQLTRLFISAEGCSPGDYIRRQRVEHIEELLRASEASLGEICRIMGFANESGFNAFFKKNNGMPPGEYRKMVKNQ